MALIALLFASKYLLRDGVPCVCVFVTRITRTAAMPVESLASSD